MKLSSSICFSIVSALAVSHVSALVLPNFKDSNSIVEKQQSIENVPTSETTTSSVDFSAI